MKNTKKGLFFNKTLKNKQEKETDITQTCQR